MNLRRSSCHPFKKMAESLPEFFFAIQKVVTKEACHGLVARPKPRPRRYDGTKFRCQFYIQIERRMTQWKIKKISKTIFKMQSSFTKYIRLFFCRNVNTTSTVTIPANTRCECHCNCPSLVCPPPSSPPPPTSSDPSRPTSFFAGTFILLHVYITCLL